MSADEFDPYIERLFARTPSMPDAALFAAEVETKLASSSRVRTIALTLAGLVGGVVAVRESMNVDLNVSSIETPAAGVVLDRGFQTVSLDVQNAVQAGLEQFGLANVELGSMGGMQLFWITAGAIIALAAAGVMKLSQEV
jgi:hypothetical protein